MAFFSAVFGTQAQSSQTATNSFRAGIFAQDDAAAKTLIATGDRVETERAVLWFDRGSMSSEARVAFGSQVNRGIGDLEKFLGITVEPARFGVDKIPYFVTSLAGISHADLRGELGVFLKIEWVKDGSAPYVHETAHYLLSARPRADFQNAHPSLLPWLNEGFAGYVEDAVFERFGGRPSRVFTKGGNAGVDGEALAFLRTEAGNGVLPFVGTEGMHAESSDRSSECCSAVLRLIAIVL